MIRRCVEQILNLYNFIDGIMVADEEGNIEYYQTFRPDLNDLKMEKIIVLEKGQKLEFSYQRE